MKIKKTMKKNILKLFLFVSLGLITTLVFTSASLHIDVPGPPGRPVITDINRHGCTITWAPPRYDGGSRVTKYQVEYRYVTSEGWIHTQHTKNENSREIMT